MQSGAYVVKGSGEALPRLVEVLEKSGLRITGSSDAYTRVYESFGMGDAQELRTRAMLRAFGEEGRVFVLAMPSLTSEAQNALLKILEEPPEGTSFFFLLPAPETLLRTFLSRVQEFSLGEKDTAPLKDARLFLKSDTNERLEMVSAYLPKKKSDDDEESEASKRDVAGALQFLGALEEALYKTGDIEKDASVRAGVRALYRARAYATDKGSLLKALLEQVAFLVPRM